MRVSALFFALACGLLPVGAAIGRLQNAVLNPSFDQDAEGDGVPDGWGVYGRAGVDQRLTRARDPERGWVAQLACTRFEPGFPDSHAMLAQLGQVGARRGQGYRLSLWARAEGLEGGAVSVALVNRRRWDTVGLQEAFVPDERWQRFEFYFQASEDLAPEDSRFQIWFNRTGTVWVDDLELEPIAEFRRQWHPELPLEGVTNALPNSSFECGGAGWGGWAMDIPGWGGQFYWLPGEWDEQQAFHGRHSWRVSLSPDTLPVYHFDYFEPVGHPVRSLLLGHHGWVPVKHGRPYVFSAYVKADRPDLPVCMVVQQSDGRSLERAFSIGQQWTRVRLVFTAETGFACGLVGLDLREAKTPQGTLWLDALQWEEGEEASAYAPREALEATIEINRLGHLFTEPQRGLEFHLRAFNAAGTPRTLRGGLAITDFLDRIMWQEEVELEVPAGQAKQHDYRGLLAGRQGFFRLHWQPESGLPEALRCAVIEPYRERDSLFGMNHAFPWDFLLLLAQQAGVTWWRDWSFKWNTVQAEPGRWDFAVPDPQIERVLAVGGNLLLLLPFPSARWAAKPDWERIEAEAGGSAYLRTRLPLALKPENVEAFGAYAYVAVERYWPRVQAFEILNEPLFTTYALPARFGYTTQDYLDLLRTAYQSAKAASSQITIIGGISSPPDLRWVREFIDQGGLRWCDAMNLHLYPHAGWPESEEPVFREVWQRMQERGEAKPIWLTEFGCYADDDPPFTPFRISDSAMNQALRRNEWQAASDLVRFVAIFLANGIRKVFYHAGTCGGLDRDDSGNVFFEYGGTPRKQYAAQAVLARLLGPDVTFVRKWSEPEWLWAYEFRSRGRTVVILWNRKQHAPPLPIPAGLQAMDLMGNPLPGAEVMPGETPVYLVGP